MTYDEAVRYIHGLKRGSPGLSRMYSALKRLGNPEERFAVVHVAGTNGKGSTSAMIESILRAAGYTTGLFTSPYLDSFTNRIKLAGEDIAPQELVNLVSELRHLVEEEGLTQFEFVTALSLAYFAKRAVEVVVLEVGLGGRLDATNAVIKPILTVITNIGYDHMEVLGHSLAKIAAEKAGILKSAVPLVTAVEGEEAWGVIESRARELGVPVRRLSTDFTFSCETSNLAGQSFAFRDSDRELTGLVVSLLGSHQLKNASVAVAAALWLNNSGLKISEEALRSGLSLARWPGRFEVMSHSPLVIMDGSHNTHGVRALRATLDDLLPGRTLHWVVGMMEDKEIEPMFRLMLGRDVSVYACAPNIPRAKNAESLADTARSLGFPTLSFGSVGEAIDSAMEQTQAGEAMLIAGSLYVVSEARNSLLK